MLIEKENDHDQEIVKLKRSLNAEKKKTQELLHQQRNREASMITTVAKRDSEIENREIDPNIYFKGVSISEYESYQDRITITNKRVSQSTALAT